MYFKSTYGGVSLGMNLLCFESFELMFFFFVLNKGLFILQAFSVNILVMCLP